MSKTALADGIVIIADIDSIRIKVAITKVGLFVFCILLSPIVRYMYSSCVL